MLILLLLPPKLRMLELTSMLRLGENAEAGVAVASSKRAVFIMVSMLCFAMQYSRMHCKAKDLEILNE